ncbi:MAG: glycosyltransferase family 4 protein [Anaerolineae bacterium]|nr:glycosyltransferase family 4 protein [Anaerolineae bacterium]
MKLVVVGHPFVVPANRTAWRHLAQMHPQDVDVTIVPPAQWTTQRYGQIQQFEPVAEQAGNYAVEPLRFEGMRVAGGRLHHYVGLEALLRRRSPDVICITHERQEWPCFFALRASRRAAPQAKMVGFSLMNIEYQLRRPDHLLKEWHFFRHMDGVLASDHDSRRILQAHGYKGQVDVQYPLGAVEEPAAIVPMASRPESPFTIGFVGTLSSEKGVADLIEAGRRLRGNWRLKLIGDGPDRHGFEAQAADLGDRVAFLGLQPRTAISTHMQSFHVLVLPSRTTTIWKEQFGVVLVEAMLAGTTVIGSDSGAIPEVIGDAGMIFPEGDAVALSDCLQKLCDDVPLRVNLAEQGLRRARRLFSAAAMAERFYRFCQSLVTPS